MADTMALVLSSETADKLQAAATMASGAAAMGVETHLFLTFWGLHAFRRSVIGTQLPMSAGYGETAEQMGKLMRDKGVAPWHEVLRDAKDVGDVRFHACAMTADLMDLTEDDLDPMVDDVIGVATFVELSAGARTLFI
jgi:peroxiredoxin family protein